VQPLTTAAIEHLAPDAASLKAGRGLATERSWVSCGHDDQGIWGECRGSGSQPYRVQVDAGDPAIACSCPSRKRPCKHSLGLLLLYATQPAAVPAAEPPAWVRARRTARETRQPRRPVASTTKPKDATRTERTADAREAKVAAGMAELKLWLHDLVRQGLIRIPEQGPAPFAAMAARMVDAQAPGVARILRDQAAGRLSGPDWEGRLLERLGLLYLLVEGYERSDTLAPALRDTIRTTIGFTHSHKQVLEGSALRDDWLVVGVSYDQEEKIRVRRTWLWGMRSERPGLLLDFAAPGKQLAPAMLPGWLYDADMVFFPAAFALRVLERERYAVLQPCAAPPGGSISTALQRYAAALAANPWLDRLPLLLADVRLVPGAEHWSLVDQDGLALKIGSQFAAGWPILSAAGGHPCWIGGEWDGRVFQPLAACVGGQWMIVTDHGQILLHDTLG
jgi:hypothetical protein